MSREQLDLFGAPPVPILFEPLEPELPALQEGDLYAPGDPEAPPDDDIAHVPVSDEQLFLFDLTEPWRIEWAGMPEFTTEDLTPVRSVIVHFESDGDVALFEDLVKQSLGKTMRSIWYPEAEIMRMADKRYVGSSRSNSAPIYIVSKGRWESRLTNKHLAKMGVRHYVVVEEAEADLYRANLELADVLVLDPKYKEQYDCFDEFGLTKSTGPGPARNFAWDHAIASGAAWHWVMDDNIDGFFRLNYNLKTPAVTTAIFAEMEAFCDRYDNVGMAGPNYFMFASRKTVMPAYVPNTRIYSCNLIRNDLPLRWRGRYNEDTDLSLNMLKAGWCTVQFNAFLQYKTPTQSMAGGNTDEFYASEGTRPKSEMLARMHPDVARVVERFQRVHHYVDYSRWKSMPLKRKPGLIIPEGIDNFGMVLQQKIGEQWVEIDKPKSEPRKTKYSQGINGGG